MNKRWKTAAIILLAIFISAIALNYYMKSGANDSGSLATEDGVKISYEFHEVSGKGVILLHMMDRNRNDYKELAELLNKEGYSTIAIDMRGHGKSDGNWRDFNENDFKNMLLDIKAADDFLRAKGVKTMAIVGASITANLALNYAPETDIKAIVLLSPGEDYHGITILDVLNNYKGRMLLVASKDDSESYSTVQKMDSLFDGSHKFVSYETGGHGTNILLMHPELKQTIIDFLNTN